MGKLRLRRVAICPMPRSQGVTELASKPDGVAPEPTRLPPCDAWDRSARDLHGKPTKQKLFARDSERASDFAQGRTAGQGFNAHRWLGRKARVLGTVGSHVGVAAGKFHPHRSFSGFKKPAVEVQGCSPTLLRQGLRAAGAGPVCPPPGLSLLGWIVPTGHWPERLSLSLTASATPPLPAAPQRCHGNRMGISKASPSIIWASDLGQACNEGTVC